VCFLKYLIGVQFEHLKPQWQKGKNTMAGKKGQKLNVQLTEEEYGWLVRYADKTD
jgi:hypothetical protein